MLLSKHILNQVVDDKNIRGSIIDLAILFCKLNFDLEDFETLQDAS